MRERDRERVSPRDASQEKLRREDAGKRKPQENFSLACAVIGLMGREPLAVVTSRLLSLINCAMLRSCQGLPVSAFWAAGFLASFVGERERDGRGTQ